MLVQGNNPVSFNYSTFDQTTGLHVAALIYDVTSGVPSLVGSAVAMTDHGDGTYFGSFTPLPNHAYLVITSVYLDPGFTTTDPNRSPGGLNYEAYTNDTATLNFNYGAYDLYAGLTINTTIYNLTNSTQSSGTMAHVANGIYFGQYVGAIGKSYLVTKVATDPDRSPGSDSFQAYSLAPPIFYELSNALLDGQSLDAILEGQSLDAILEEA